MPVNAPCPLKTKSGRTTVRRSRALAPNQQGELRIAAKRSIQTPPTQEEKGAAHRILRDAGLVRKRPRKHQRKADLRAIKAAHPPLCRMQMEVCYLNNIPQYSKQMRKPGMPGFQYTVHDEATGTLFVSYATERSKAYNTTLTARQGLQHLHDHGAISPRYW